MDAHCKELLEQFKAKQPVLLKIQEIVVNELNSYVKQLKMIVNSVESRVKTEKSLIGKLELKGYKYKTINDITDLFGARVVTFYADEVDKVASLITKKFDVDWDNSIDKRKIHNVDQFGYMSLHFVCSIPKEMYYDENMPEINEVKFEIQLRTTLQHTWATICHDTGYKNDVEVPKEFLRELNRLAGLLEIADDEFNHIRTGLADYRRKVKLIVKSGDFKDIELNGDTFKEYLKVEPFNKINKHISEIDNMEIENVPMTRLLYVYKSLGFKTIDDIHQMLFKYFDSAYQLALSMLAGLELDIVSSLIGPQYLCSAYIIDVGGGEQGLIMMMNTLFGPRASNNRFAHKLMKNAYNLGLVKDKVN